MLLDIIPKILTLSEDRGLTGLVDGDLVIGVLTTLLAGTKGTASLRNVHLLSEK